MAHFEVLAADEFETAVRDAARPFVIDVRDRAAYETAHVPGSHAIHVHEIAARRDELPARKVTRILVVGDEEKRTRAAANWFVLMGYPDVAVLRGGFAAWKGPVESGPEPPPKPRGPELRIL